MRKLERDIRNRLAKLGVKVIGRSPVPGHVHYTIELPNGDRHKLVTANTPTIPEYTTAAVVRDVKRMMR